jgi:hypothetical protein
MCCRDRQPLHPVAAPGGKITYGLSDFDKALSMLKYDETGQAYAMTSGALHRLGRTVRRAFPDAVGTPSHYPWHHRIWRSAHHHFDKTANLNLPTGACGDGRFRFGNASGETIETG